MSSLSMSRDAWGILKLSEGVYHIPEALNTKSNSFKQSNDHCFQKAFLVTHEDIFNAFAAEDAYDVMYETLWEKVFPQ